ncbi:MAG: vWA domain-containing protein [Streptosporangiaceae bacterium]
MTSWIRRSFSAPGLTQIPPGPRLDAVAGRFGGTVMLCIDVSGSMNGMPITQAVDGARQFVAEAVAAHYRVGVMLWNHRVEAVCEPGTDGAASLDLLAGVRSALGGNDLLIALTHCHQILGRFTGDRVVALFGDGDLTPKDQVLVKVAQMKAENIRFVTRGLGSYAATEFGEISDEEAATAAIEDVADLADGIADMATSLRRYGLTR